MFTVTGRSFVSIQDGMKSFESLWRSPISGLTHNLAFPTVSMIIGASHCNFPVGLTLFMKLVSWPSLSIFYHLKTN